MAKESTFLQRLEEGDDGATYYRAEFSFGAKYADDEQEHRAEHGVSGQPQPRGLFGRFRLFWCPRGRVRVLHSSLWPPAV